MDNDLRHQKDLAEKMLKESEEKYRLLVDLSPDAIIVHSQGKLLFANKTTLSLIGAESFDQIKDIPLIAFVHPDYRFSAIERIQKIYETREPSGYLEEKFITLNNEIIDVEVIGIPVSFMGQPAVQTIIRNISERKLTQETLLKLNNAIENSGEVIFMTDKEGIFTFVNPRFTEMYGYTAEEVIDKKTPRILKSGHISTDIYENFWKAILDKQNLSSQYVNKCKDGTLIDVESSANPILDAQGGIIGFLSIQRDISERKQSEAALLAAKEKAEESDRLKTAFMHNISHEIRTPMNAIVGFSALLADPDLDPESHSSYAEIITQSSDHLLTIVDDIIEISNIEAGIIKIKTTEIKLNTLLHSLYRQFNSKAVENGIDFSLDTDLADGNDIILTDSKKLIQIISNLLSNALKFTNSGRIKLGYKLKNGFLEFHVTDTGIGIPADKQARIFDRFYQIDNSSSRKYEGTGIGLSISKAYIELVGGNIGVSSKEGIGSDFFFSIPYFLSDYKHQEPPHPV